MEKPVFSVRKEDFQAISGQDLVELMRGVLDKGANFQFRAKGWSIVPFIHSGDRITITPLTLEKLGISKVVAFINPTSCRLMVHRIVGKRGETFLVHGDNESGKPEGWVNRQYILGCVTQVNRNGRRVFLGLGPERALLAFFTRQGWFVTILRKFKAIKRILLRKTN